MGEGRKRRGGELELNFALPLPPSLPSPAALASLLAADPKWKKFNLLVDKSLASFDGVKEWADFISFLSKLLKVSSLLSLSSLSVLCLLVSLD